MTLDQAAQVTNKTISKELALPPVKLHCSMLAEDAITVSRSVRFQVVTLNTPMFLFLVCYQGLPIKAKQGYPPASGVGIRSADRNRLNTSTVSLFTDPTTSPTIFIAQNTQT